MNVFFSNIRFKMAIIFLRQIHSFLVGNFIYFLFLIQGVLSLFLTFQLLGINFVIVSFSVNWISQSTNHIKCSIISKSQFGLGNLLLLHFLRRRQQILVGNLI